MFDSWVEMIPWRRECLPTLVSLPGEFHGQKRLAGTVYGVAKCETLLSDFHFSPGKVNGLQSVQEYSQYTVSCRSRKKYSATVWKGNRKY